MQLPCIVSDVGDSKQVVGENGVYSHENMQDLVVEIERFVKMPKAERLEVGRDNRRRIIQHYSIESMV